MLMHPWGGVSFNYFIYTITYSYFQCSGSQSRGQGLPKAHKMRGREMINVREKIKNKVPIHIFMLFSHKVLIFSCLFVKYLWMLNWYGLVYHSYLSSASVYNDCGLTVIFYSVVSL